MLIPPAAGSVTFRTAPGSGGPTEKGSNGKGLHAPPARQSRQVCCQSRGSGLDAGRQRRRRSCPGRHSDRVDSAVLRAGRIDSGPRRRVADRDCPGRGHPGDTFAITGTTTQTVFPPAAQQAGAVFGADGIQGIISIFETNLQNATVSFANTAGGNPAQSSPSQFNAVAAVQPPNQAASNPRINGGDTTRGGFQPATPAETFSFGDAPTDSSGASGNSYAPTPGVGGGFTSGAGTPDVVPDLGPITVTGAVGDNVVIQNKNPGGPDVAGIPAGNPRVVQDAVSFHQPAGTFTTQFPADCAFDTSPDAIPSPNPSYVSQFTIPIVAGGGGTNISGLTPDHGSTDGGTVVSIHGFGFTDATDVEFGGVPATSFDVTSNSLIRAVAPPGTGTVDVAVTSPQGTSPNEADDDYTYDAGSAPAPAITSLTPDNGPAAGGNMVSIAGANLSGAGASDLNFGDNAATGVVVVDDTTITATAPAGSGTVGVSVTTPSGPSPEVDYTYNAPPPPSGGGSGGGGGAGGGGSLFILPRLSLGAATLKSPTKAVLTVTASGPGNVKALDGKASGLVLPRSASKKKKKKALIKKSSAHVAQAGPVKLRIKLSAAGRRFRRSAARSR